MSAPVATLHEIFSSRQGEGFFTGDWMTFVRFQGCALRCQWCDTPHALAHRRESVARIETPAQSAQFAAHDNPITIGQLNTLLAEFPDDTLALTGGEPLEQADFIAAWLGATPHRQRILLETGGVLTKALRAVLPHIDVVSMDLKLPSSTGMRSYWREHREFLRTACDSAATTYVKIVVTAQTTDDDIAQGLTLVADGRADTPTFLQIASATADFGDVPTAARAAAIVDAWRSRLPQLQVGRQMHKIWNVL